MDNKYKLKALVQSKKGVGVINTPNLVLYLLLLVLFIVITILSLLIDQTSKWFSIVTGVGCGGFASVIVAFLIDLANCRDRNKKQMYDAIFVLNNFRIAVCFYLETFADMCVDIEPEMKKQKHVFEEWLHLYLDLINKHNCPVRRLWLIDAIDRIDQAFSVFENNIYWLVDGNVISLEEYKKHKMLNTTIRTSKIHYLISDREPKPDIILEENNCIIKQMKLMVFFEELLNTPYYGNGDLTELFNAIDEYDYLQ